MFGIYNSIRIYMWTFLINRKLDLKQNVIDEHLVKNKLGNSRKNNLKTEGHW